MEDSNSLIIIPKELEVLSTTLLNKDDSSIYDTLDQIFSIIDKYPYIDEYILSSRSDETQRFIKELELENGKALRELKILLKRLEKAFPKDKEMKKHWILLDDFLTMPAEEDPMYSYYLGEKLKAFVGDAIDKNLLTIEDDVLKGFLALNKRNNLLLRWDNDIVISYLEGLKFIQREENTKAWYHYMNLRHLSYLWSSRYYKREFPASFYDSFLTTLDISKFDEYPTLSVMKYHIDEVKASWAQIYSHLEGSNNLSKPAVIILFDSDTGVFQLMDGTQGKFSKKKPSYKIMEHFSKGNTSFDFSTILSSDDCDTRNDIAKYLRRKLKLSKDQLVNKDGFLSLLGVNIAHS